MVIMQTRSGPLKVICRAALAFMLAHCVMNTRNALAISIELNDAATARMERRNAARDGRLLLPLPGTPDTGALPTRIAAMGVNLGASALIRIFKAESELEIWMSKDGAYVHFATYPICYWSGTSGPKLREGDRQTPEGFYTITSGQLHSGGRWPRSLDIGFPNTYDRIHQRSGSHILVHGGCNSIGCFAVTDAVNAEIYDIVSAALRLDTLHVPVHVFPFRMTEENLAAHASGAWTAFWRSLKHGYDSFERTRLPPRISVCEGSYRIDDAIPGEGHRAGPLKLCSPAISVPSADAIQVAQHAPVQPAITPPEFSPGPAASNRSPRARTTVANTPAAATPKARKNRSAAQRCSIRSRCRARTRSARQKARRRTERKYAGGRGEVGRHIKVR